MHRTMRIFITGGTGFVGGALITRLKKSHKIKAMTRSEAGSKKIAALGAEPVKCSLQNIKAEHLQGSQVVIHSAAYVEEWGSRKDFWQANVEGTRNMIAAAREAGIQRFIFIGTEAALFDGHDLKDIDEQHPYPASTPFLYSETKREAEKIVLSANGPGLLTLSIRPRFVWGPGDTSILPTIIEMVTREKFMWLNNGEALTSTTYIDNLTQCVERALGRGQGGHAYFVADKQVNTMKSFLTRMLETQGITIPEKSVPAWLAKTAAFIVETIWRLFRIKSKPPMTRFGVSMLAANCTVKTDKARRELGYAPEVTVDQGLFRMSKVS